LYPLIPERRGYNDQIIISHFGMKKSYISLLEREYQETPEDFMIQIWVAEELVDKRQFDSALKTFCKFYANDGMGGILWLFSRAKSYCMSKNC